MELVAAIVNLWRPAVTLIITIPVLVTVPTLFEKCALSTNGHSMLQKCGSEFLSLDDFFESVNRANVHFWTAFSKVANAVRRTGQQQLANVVDGVAYYGDATSSPIGIFSITMNSVKIPFADLGNVITK